MPQGWTGKKCVPCNGTGCQACGHTGDEYGPLPRFRLLDEGEAICEGTLDEIINPDDSAAEELREELPRLQVGQSYAIGGGAAALFVVERLS